MTDTEKFLLASCGGSPLLSLHQLAGVLHRSADGLRVSMRGNDELSLKLQASKVKIGRRIYFRLAAVASIIDQAQA